MKKYINDIYTDKIDHTIDLLPLNCMQGENLLLLFSVEVLKCSGDVIVPFSSALEIKSTKIPKKNCIDAEPRYDRISFIFLYI